MTVTTAETLKSVLTKADPNKIADALAKVNLGNMVVPNKQTYTGLVSAAAHDLTDVAHGGQPAAMVIGSVRVTAGAAAAGLRQIGDAAATPSATVATISDDGKTITFEAGVTAFIVSYLARSASDVTALFNRA